MLGPRRGCAGCSDSSRSPHAPARSVPPGRGSSDSQPLAPAAPPPGGARRRGWWRLPDEAAQSAVSEPLQVRVLPEAWVWGLEPWRGGLESGVFRPKNVCAPAVHLWHCILPTQSEKLARRDISSCGSTETRRGTLTALKSLAGSRRSQQRTARRRAAAAAAGSPQATLAFQNSPGRGLRCRAAAAAAARGLPTHSGARRAGARPPTTGDAGAEIIRGPSGRALTAPRRARAAAAAARGRPTHTAPRGGRARALPQLGRGRSPQLEKRAPQLEKRTPQYFAAKGPRPHLLSTQVRSRR